MDPNKILSEKPGVVYMDPAWNKSPTPKPGYIAVKTKTVTYADGRIVRTALNDDGSELSVIDTTYDVDQKKVFDDSAKTAQTQTDQAERKVKSVTYDAQGRKVTTYADGSTSTEEKAPAATANDPGAQAADQNAVELQRQRVANAALPKDQDPAYETDAERRARAAATIKEQGAAKPASPIVSTRTEKDARTGNTVTVNTHQDGTETRSESVVSGTPLGQHGAVKSVTTKTENGKTVKVTTYEDNFVQEQREEDVGTGATLPKGVPRWELPPPTATAQEIIRAVNDRWSQLSDLADQGIITPKQALDIFTPEHATGTALVADFNSRRSSGLTERGQDVSLTTSRAGTATSIFNSPLVKAASDAGGKFLPGPGSGEAASKFVMALMQMGAKLVQQMGGQATIPGQASYANGQGATNTGMPGISIFMGQQPQPGTSVPAMAGPAPAPLPGPDYGGVPVLPPGLQPPGGFPGGGAGTPMMAPPAPIAPEPMPSVLPHEDVLQGFMQEAGIGG